MQVSPTLSGKNKPPLLDRRLKKTSLNTVGAEGVEEVMGNTCLGSLVLLLDVVFCCAFFNLFSFLIVVVFHSYPQVSEELGAKKVISLQLSSRLGNICFSCQSTFNILLHKYSKNCLSRTQF